jgi:hypothetical protein
MISCDKSKGKVPFKYGKQMYVCNAPDERVFLLSISRNFQQLKITEVFLLQQGLLEYLPQ